MRTVIIDDESKGRQALRNFITKYALELNLIGEADCVQAGIELIEKEKPELVFLDIQMPDGTGFDLLTQVMYDDFKLIFCTAHDKYAVKAFRFSAIDYLLKPLDPDIFTAAINKISKEDPLLMRSKLEVLNANKNDFSRIALHSAEGISLVNISQIIRLESSVNYTNFVIEGGTNILVSKTLKEYDEILSQQGFVRVHKSHLVNISHVTKYIKGEGGWVVMTDCSKIEVSRRKKEVLLNSLDSII